MKCSIFSGHKALEIIGKLRNHNARVQRRLEFPTASDYTRVMQGQSQRKILFSITFTGARNRSRPQWI